MYSKSHLLSLPVIPEYYSERPFMGTMAPADDGRRSRSPVRTGAGAPEPSCGAARRSSRRESPLVERPDDVTMGSAGDKGKGKAAKGKGKRKGGDDQDTPQNIEVLTLLLRTCATVSRHQSYLVQTILMGANTRVGARGLEAEDNYKDRTYGKKGHGIGKPDTYIFFVFWTKPNNLPKRRQRIPTTRLRGSFRSTHTRRLKTTSTLHRFSSAESRRLTRVIRFGSHYASTCFLRMDLPTRLWSRLIVHSLM